MSGSRSASPRTARGSPFAAAFVLAAGLLLAVPNAAAPGTKGPPTAKKPACGLRSVPSGVYGLSPGTPACPAEGKKSSSFSHPDLNLCFPADHHVVLVDGCVGLTTRGSHWEESVVVNGPATFTWSRRIIIRCADAGPFERYRVTKKGRLRAVRGAYNDCAKGWSKERDEVALIRLAPVDLPIKGEVLELLEGPHPALAHAVVERLFAGSLGPAGCSRLARALRVAADHPERMDATMLALRILELADNRCLTPAVESVLVAGNRALHWHARKALARLVTAE